MQHVFRSKVDRWLIVVLGGAASASLLACLPLLITPTADAWMIGLSTLALGLGLPIWILASTDYAVIGTTLHVRSGPFRWTVAIDSIEAVAPTSSPLSSPALSLDRLELVHGGGRRLRVSPVDKEGFVAALRMAGARI